MVVLVAQASSASNPLGRWIIVAGGLLLLGFLIYAFVTRYRENWDDLLQRWTSTDRRLREDDDEATDS